MDRICEELKAKEKWLDEIAQSVGESRESNSSESNSNKSDSGESIESVGESTESESLKSESPESESPESSGESLSAQIKSDITALVEIMKGIHTIITGDLRANPMIR